MRSHLDRDGFQQLSHERRALLEGLLTQYSALGGNLDTKTRELIAVALNAGASSTHSVAHHLTKARAAGATHAEIVDAVLMAIPVTGFTPLLEVLPQILESLTEDEVG